MLIGLRTKNFGILGDTMIGIVGSRLLELGPDAGLTPVTALIGRNSTGKSTVLDALSFLSDCLKDGVPAASSAPGRDGFTEMRTSGSCGAGQMELEIAVEAPDRSCVLDYTLRLACDAHGRPVVDFESVRRLETNPDGIHVFLEILRLEAGKGSVLECAGDSTSEPCRRAAGVMDLRKPGLSTYGTLLEFSELHALLSIVTSWYFCRFDLDAARATRAVGGHHHVSPTADNLANVLRYLEEEDPKKLRGFLERVSRRMPGLGTPHTSLSPDGKLLLRFDRADGTQPIFLNRLSDGSIKLFTYLLLLEDPTPRPLVCLEEPESGLYHDMIEPLAEEFRRHASGIREGEPGTQVLFTTHHPYLLDSLRPEEVWVLERQADGLASARRIGDDPVVLGMFDQGVGMAALWYGNYLDRS
jgi:predicted ATPase